MSIGSTLTYSFTSDGIVFDVVVTELGDGQFAFDVSINMDLSTQVGDIRAFYFDVEGDVDAMGLSIEGTSADSVVNQVYDVSLDDTYVFDESDVKKVESNDANMNGEVKGSDLFDAGVEFGDQGAAHGDDYQSVSFIVSGAEELTLEDFNLQSIGIRLTSVGEVDGSRGDSLKISDTSDGEIENPNSAPDATDNLLSTDEATAASGNLLTDNDGFGVDSDPDGDVLTVTEVSFGAVGATTTIAVDSGSGLTADLAVNADGTYSVSPGAGFDALSVGDSETISFSYTISDGNGGVDSANVTITINGLNEAPTAANDEATTDEATAVSGNVLANDTDANGDDLTVTEVSSGDVGVAATVSTDSGAFEGELTVNADGSYTFVPGAGLTALPFGATETVTVTYTADDGNGGTDTATLTITIEGLNEGPVAAADAKEIDEDGAIAPGSAQSLNILDNDTDANGDSLAVSSIVGGLVGAAFLATTAGGTEVEVTVAENGDVTFDTAGLFDTLAAGETDSFQLTYTVSDGNGGEDTSTVTITINGLNEAPTATDDAVSTDEETAIAGNIISGDNGNGVDSDANGDVLSVSSVSFGDVGVAQTVSTDSGNFSGELTVNPDGSYEFTPGAALDALPVGATETVTFEYAISDGNGGSDTATVVITINGLNEAPVAEDDAGTISASGEIGTGDSADFSLNVLDNDSDPNGDALSVSTVEGQPAGSVVTVETAGGRQVDVKILANGQVQFDANGQFADLDEEASDSFTVNYTADDGNGGADDASVTITVNGEGGGGGGEGISYNIVFLVDASGTSFQGNTINPDIFRTDDTQQTINTAPYDPDLTNGVAEVNMNPTVAGVAGGDSVANSQLDAGLFLAEQFRKDLQDADAGADVNIGVATFALNSAGNGTSYSFFTNDQAGDSLVFTQNSDNLTDAYANSGAITTVSAPATLNGAYSAANFFFSEATANDGSGEGATTVNLVYILSAGSGIANLPTMDAQALLPEAMELFGAGAGQNDADIQLVSFMPNPEYTTFGQNMILSATQIGQVDNVQAAESITASGGMRDFLDAELAEIGFGGSTGGGGGEEEELF